MKDLTRKQFQIFPIAVPELVISLSLYVYLQVRPAASHHQSILGSRGMRSS